VTLFSFLFRSHKMPEKPLAPPAPAATPTTGGGAPVKPAAPAPPPEEMDLDDIVAAIRQIDEVIDDPANATQTGIPMVRLNSLHMPIKDMVQIMPALFSADAASAQPDEKAEILIEDLYAQLARGRVETRVSLFMAGVPSNYRSPSVEENSKLSVALPLPLVVSSINPNEFKSRTTATERKLDIRHLPNLFTATSEPPPKKPAQPIEIPLKDAAAAPKGPPVSAPQPIVTQPASKPIEPPAEASAKPIPTPPPPEPAAPLVEPPAKPKLKLKTEPVETTIPSPAAAVEPTTAAPPEPAPLPPPPPAPAPTPVQAEKVEVKRAPVAEPSPVAPPAPTVEAPPEPPPAAAPIAPSEPVAPTPVAVAAAAPEPSAPPAPPSGEKFPAAVIGGIDLNTASADELTHRLSGIGPQMALRIVEDRQQHGPFYDLYDLGRVPGVGKRGFERITGLPWREELYGQVGTVTAVLGLWEGKIPDFKGIAERFKQLPDFDGCVIIHRDGNVLASSWELDPERPIETVAPQVTKRVIHYMKSVCADETLSVTVSTDKRAFTFVQCEDICFVAVHKLKGFSRKSVQVANGVGHTIGRRCSKILKG